MPIPIPIPTPTYEELMKFARGIYGRWKRSRWLRRESASSRGRRNPDLYRILRHIYPEHTLLEHYGQICPIIAIELPREQMREPESILGEIRKEPPWDADDFLRQVGGRYVKLLRAMGRPVEDWPVFCLERIEESSNRAVELVSYVGTYSDAIATCDVLEWEILTALGNSSRLRDYSSFVRRRLKLRAFAHSLARNEDPLTNPIGRSAAIGISTMVLFNRRGTYCILVGERSGRDVAVHGNLHHVVPSFMFQPTVGLIDQEFSVVHNIFREYLEELFSIEEVRDAPSVITHDYFYRDPNLRYLRQLIEKREAAIYLTGLVFNLLNMRPEICALLHIRTPEWFENHKVGMGDKARVEFNEEWRTPTRRAHRRKSVVPVEELEGFGLSRENTVPPGLAAVALGVEAAKTLKLLT